jgi:demethylmenaquinone methyltransferase/2-methoxy-6-polyprenyl-1,4-benzoquinol methylase
LDVCCGTGDFALELVKRVGGSGRVVGADFSVPMIELARRKAARLGNGNIELVAANACRLPFSDDVFDCVTVGFGLRNVADVSAAVREMARVTKPGGRVISLEISRVKSPLLSIPWRLYFYALTPYVATALRAKRRDYEYLPRSVKGFMSKQDLARVFEKCGLVDVDCHGLTFGTVSVHVGVKP